MKTAVFHPEIAHVGGAEKLVLEWLKRTELDADVYTWVYRPEKTFKEFGEFEITPLLKRSST